MQVGKSIRDILNCYISVRIFQPENNIGYTKICVVTKNIIYNTLCNIVSNRTWSIKNNILQKYEIR